MTQMQREAVNQIEFQLSLLRLSAIPRSYGTSEELLQQTRQLQELAETVKPGRRQTAG